MAWRQVEGDKSMSIVAGYTPSSDASTSASSPTFNEIRKMAHTALKVLYFNYDQIGLLTKRLLVFLCDYGSGMKLTNQH
jgi:hypothetical protein